MEVDMQRLESWKWEIWEIGHYGYTWLGNYCYNLMEQGSVDENVKVVGLEEYK